MSVKYIIGHWTGGNYKPCATDLSSYQLLIDNNGKEHHGKPQGQSASTAGMNSITYNISCCGGLKTTPITPIQFEAFAHTCAKILKKYNLTPSNFYTHALIGQMCQDGTITDLLPKNRWLHKNIGKIDLTTLPTLKSTPSQTNTYIRQKINWYFLNTP